jgi:hypothetical protein
MDAAVMSLDDAAGTENMAERVGDALANTGWSPEIKVIAGWYY